MKSTGRVVLWLCLSTSASFGLAHDLPEVRVEGHKDAGLGSSEAASEGVIDAKTVLSVAVQRPADVLNLIPGMAVLQHSGEGKATQYVLRGMNLDHGTDFAVSIQGVPINLPTHAHGQGYADLNPLIPELVSRIEYRKGPYLASQGDFSSAGSADVVYATRLERPLFSLTLGERGHVRGLGAESREVSDGVTLLSAVERQNQNGPWAVRAGLRKSNALWVLSDDNARHGWRLSLSAYSAHWTATDQVPQRLLDAGSYLGQPFGRFDSLDPTDGGSTARFNLSGMWHAASDHELTRVEWYALHNQMTLYSNFTWALNPTRDQFAQNENRFAGGGRVYRSWLMDDAGGRDVINTLGLQWRQDQIRLGLTDTMARQSVASVRDDQVHLGQWGLYGENELRWNAWLKTVAGLRLDQLHADVNSLLSTQNSGSAQGSKVSPKFSVVLGPWHDTEVFFNAGRGLHSNDARGMTTRVDPRTLQTTQVVPALVGSLGREVGLKSVLDRQLQTQLAFWQLNFDSELVYASDTGGTQAGRPSHRHGVEWSTQWSATEHFAVMTDLAWSQARFTDPSPQGQAVPLAIPKVAQLRLVLKEWRGWHAGLGIRHLAARPLTSDASWVAPSTTRMDVRVMQRVSEQFDWSVDVLNLANQKHVDAAYAYVSRLVGEPVGGVYDMHVHPAAPRTIRVTTTWRF